MLTAARATHKSVNEFVLDCTLIEAEKLLADRRIFTLDRKSWSAFVEALNAPPRPNRRLRRLFSDSSDASKHGPDHLHERIADIAHDASRLRSRMRRRGVKKRAIDKLWEDT